MIRLGLCCQFAEEPIRFRTTTAAAVARLSRENGLERISAIGLDNANSLLASLKYCDRAGIGCFRILSQILPLRTHPAVGYEPEELPDYRAIVRTYRECRRFANDKNIRRTFHPDQFVVLSSPSDAVVASSMAELEHQAELAEWLGADVVNVHGGGAYGDKEAALGRFAENARRLSRRARQRLTVENDDVVFTVSDLQPVCRAEGIPLVYDVHHHRCHGDGLSVAEATDVAMTTWNREPLFHISSPREGWQGPRPQRHHDYIHFRDFPKGWLGLELTVEVEAKAKELAVARLRRAITRTSPRG